MSEKAIEEFRVVDEPFYLPVAGEVSLFEAAHAARLPVILKGPTGCGKTRFVEHMAWRLERPLITVACHEDLSSTDLVGRFLLEGEEADWQMAHLPPQRAGWAPFAISTKLSKQRKDTVVTFIPDRSPAAVAYRKTRERFSMRHQTSCS